MRGLTAMERQALVSSAAPNDPNWEEVDSITDAAELAATESLILRGCVHERDIDLPSGEEITTWDITPRGRLALLCHQTVTAGMVSA